MNFKKLSHWLGGYLMMLFLSCNIWAQKPAGTPSVASEAFDKKLEKLLRFSVPVISVQQLQQNPGDYIVFDAREKEEYEVSHIEGAQWIGYDSPDFTVLDAIPSSKKVVVYCSVGYRSEKIAEKLKEKGLSDVYNLYGSIFEWVNKGYPVVNAEGETVSRIHTYNEKWSQWVDNPTFKKVY
jgi:rhodanese-related sulfurtransferase